MKSTFLSVVMLVLISAVPIIANAGFTLSSSLFEDGGTLPASSKCTRDGGDGLSPPIVWSDAPAGTKSFAVIMHHYPRNAVEGRDNPSHYWLLWDIPVHTKSLSRGNAESIGNEGGEKDKRYVGYTSPCSPANVSHAYTITVYALDTKTSGLGNKDDIDVDWVTMTKAIEDKVITSSSLTFNN